MKSGTWTLLAVMTLAIAGCGRGERVPFDGQFFRASAKAPRADRHNFTATAGPVSRGIEGAAQAARYEATRHCLRFYGSSDIAYALPESTPGSQLPRAGQRVVVQGRCLELE